MLCNSLRFAPKQIECLPIGVFTLQFKAGKLHCKRFCIAVAFHFSPLLSIISESLKAVSQKFCCLAVAHRLSSLSLLFATLRRLCCKTFCCPAVAFRCLYIFESCMAKVLSVSLLLSIDFHYPHWRLMKLSSSCKCLGTPKIT